MFAMAKNDGIARTFYVKGVEVKGKHDTPTVTMENALKTEKIKIVFEDKEALKEFTIDDEFTFIGKKQTAQQRLQ